LEDGFAPDGVTPGGYADAIGIVYSETANQLYTSTLSPTEACVAGFDLDLNYLGVEVPTPGTGSNAKGIAITKECCPANNNQIIDTTLCDVSEGEILFLSELIQWELSAKDFGKITRTIMA